MNKWNLISWCALLLAAAVLVSPVLGQSGEDQTLGEKVDHVVGQIEKGARHVASGVKKEFERARAYVDRMGVAARVYARIHWDKALQGASVSVDITKGGVATLRGTVPNETAKTKAETLTRDTVGVERVVDDLKVASPPGR